MLQVPAANKKARLQRRRAFSYREGEQFLNLDSRNYYQIPYQILERSAAGRIILLPSWQPKAL
jgi:hypothetical protein